MLYSVTGFLMISELGLSKPIMGVVLTIFMWGQITGGLLWAYLGDLIGRKRSWVGSIVFMCLGAILAAIAPNWVLLSLGRAMTGFGTVGSQAPQSSFISETWPARHRAKCMSLSWAMWGPAVVFLGLLSLAGLYWRYCWVLVGLIGFSALFFIQFSIKETERYTEYDKKVGSLKQKFKETIDLYRDPRWRKRLIIGATIPFASLTVLWSFTTYTPVFLIERGFGAVVGLHWNMLIWGVGGTAALLWGPLADKVGRKRALVVSAIANVIGVVGTFFWAPNLVWIYVLSALAVWGQLSSYMGIMIYVPEPFPTKIRSTAYGVANQTGRILARSFQRSAALWRCI